MRISDWSSDVCSSDLLHQRGGRDRGRLPGCSAAPGGLNPQRLPAVIRAAAIPPATREPTMDRPPLPPFTRDTAARKVRLAEDAWNMREPSRVALAYTTDSRWRNRSEFLQGRDEITSFLERKWQREREYRLTKALWAFHEDRIAVQIGRAHV